ncbi:hypothetical protein BB560_000363 [Smittium megazygosporum]|uniref:Uncharacterized protein n=1 Tax=Smittium megazygosporum TaxID=133381 RepID=A0A2T9ZKK5_9FUNG|nr:hypothetical protein BB560_000363 [Smittium megazygosporum]
MRGNRANRSIDTHSDRWATLLTEMARIRPWSSSLRIGVCEDCKVPLLSDRRLSSAYFNSIENVFRRENTFFAQFETLGSNESQNAALVLDCRVESSEITAVIGQNYSESRNSRAVIVWKLGANHAT